MSAPTRRRWMVVPVVALHAAALGLIAMAHGAPVNAPAAGRSIALFDVASAPAEMPAVTEAAPDAEPVPAPIIPVALVPTPLSIAPPVMAITDTSTGIGEPCDLAARVRDALRGDAAVQASLGRLPHDARSVANAVMLWDGRWIDGADRASHRALDTVRQAVLATVAQAPGICRTETQTGPSLLTLAGPPDTVLALGSGQWRWDDLFLTAGPPVANEIRGPRIAGATSPSPGT
ncbi:hypothetical protein PQ455_04255 [Sphingomonas naphthae]|uniref:Uncharacterized protein n=1 Tax=Sphingomonas naphthae TaxID=1813468 RepID=A0ABY7TN96_9SPHN|nr:hypothetical protein [Sphingomonas naphthae]WCT74451.1 hypothetical protein PQ455_04255 [Sphingomonas naphthae]